MDKGAIDYSLYLVTDRELLSGKDLANTVEEAIKGSVSLVQIREKNISTLDFFQLALQVKGITTTYGVPFIVNDRVDIALAVDADGVHIGQEDMPLPVARNLLGPTKIIGVSVSTLEEALRAQEEGADYLGIGALFPTLTKSDADHVSLEDLGMIKEKIKIPIVGIGGINGSNIHHVIATGVDGAAVVSAIIAATNPREAAWHLRQIITK
ncbi:thiamine phosphate synthase [Pelosinus sp. UFO1]|uniref:thiamine phosphate synthase n=1 Tax=Pelosinus sp. UFO1 TaxID=484770 RepID=UPI0004D0EAD1|nr:thiamine phosphate synthase [Pelosinus sp. UFO1]AIF52760.1 Thiamine-phosphate pyrophosphorylase [Pelosinus sp. UFO1]